MSNRRPIIAVGILSLLVLAATVVSGKELEDRKWIEVSTADFRIRSTLSKGKTVKLVRSLDLLRLSVPIITTVSRTESAIPTNIFAVKSASDLKLFGINGGTIGMSVTGLRHNTILMRDSPNIDATAVILHEYVHFLTRNHSGTSYPR